MAFELPSHKNTFENGMVSDVDITNQPPGTSRYMKNCDIVSQSGNDYVVKDCLGNVHTVTINRRYNTTYLLNDDVPLVIQFFSLPDKLIALSTNSETGGYGEIGMIQLLPYGQGVQPKAITGQKNSGYIPLYHHASLNFAKSHKPDGVSYSENEFIERIYFSDFNNEPKVFNVSDPIFTTYIANGSIGTAGLQYMVLEGAVQYAAVNYGPGLPAGNIFTSTGNPNYTDLTGPNPTAKVVEYYPYQLLAWQPDRLLGNITFVSLGVGNVYCGNKIYFYRLSRDSTQTTWSYGGAPISVGTDNDTSYLTAIAYHNYVGGGTTSVPLNSGKSVNVKISNIDTKYKFIELACAEFDQSLSNPRQVTIVSKQTITGSTMTINHSGSVNLGLLTVGDITLFPVSLLKIKAMATHKNYLHVGNTVERPELDLTSAFTVGTLSSFQYPLNVHGDPASCTIGGMNYTGAYPASTIASPAAGTVTPWSRWYVTDGDLGANTVTYNGVNYVAGDVIVGINSAAGINAQNSITCIGTGAVRPCVSKVTNGTTKNVIQLTQGFWSYKDPAVAHHCTGYWSNELYRFGILFYDLKGNPFYVRHIGDFQFPTIANKSGLIRQDTFNGQPFYSLNPSGLKIASVTISSALAAQISGFSIVRAVRDPRIITQGLVTQCSHTGATPDVYKPGAYIPMSDDDLNVASKVYCYLCPDSDVQIPLKGTIGVISDTMEQASWVKPYAYSAGVYAKAAGGEEQVHTKFLQCEDDGSTRTGVISYFDYVNEGETLTNFGSGVTFANGGQKIDALAGAAPDHSCLSTGAYSLAGFGATACKKIVFKLDSDFNHYGPPAGANKGFTHQDNAAVPEKILMNYVKTGFSNPYGGTGVDALANTLYISTGHFQAVTGAATFTNIEIFGGDCFVNLVDIGYSLWDNGYVATGGTFSHAWFFPCESNANYDMRRGRKTSNVQMYYTNSGDGNAGPESIIYLGPSSENRPEQFSYNPGYSAEGQSIYYPALPANYVNASRFEALMRFAGKKIPGETIDSFRTFAILDKLDLGYQYGRINSLKVVKNQLVALQDLGLSSVPVLERQLNTSPSGDETIIGTGGVLDRYDVISSTYGCQHQWSVVETGYGLAFFDMRKKAIVLLSYNEGVFEASYLEGVSSDLKEAFVEAEGNIVSDATQLIDTLDFAETSDRPLMGVGITGVFDSKNKMTYMVFKFKGQKLVGGSAAYLCKDFCIGFLHTETKRQFVGYYDWLFAIAHNYNGTVISCNNPKNITQYLPTVITNFSFAVGETLAIPSVPGTWLDDYGFEYICIADVTLDSLAKYPTGASGATYWAAINATNQIWINHQPAIMGQTAAPNYQYNSWFGRVITNILKFVVNPQAPEAFEVQYMEQETPYNVNYTTVRIEAEGQSAADENITTTNKDYQFTFDKIRHNMPLSTTGRIVNNHLLVTFEKKNWLTDPRVITTSVKILKSVKSFFNMKR